MRAAMALLSLFKFLPTRCIQILFLILLRAVYLYDRHQESKRAFRERNNIISRLLNYPETNPTTSPRQEAFLDSCFWGLKCMPAIASNPEVVSHFEKKLPMLKECMVPEKKGKFELSEMEEEIVKCLKNTEYCQKFIREHPFSTMFMTILGSSSLLDLEVEKYKLGPGIQDLEDYVLEQKFDLVEMKDVEGFEEN